MDITNNDIVPEQSKGIQTNTEHSLQAKNKDEALDLYKRACKRLLNINIWDELSGEGSAKFVLENQDGNEEHRLAELDDYFRIDLPGPGTVAGGGYDWVKVEKIEDNSNAEGEMETFEMQVRPCTNPTKAGEDIAHFLTDDSTSTFIIKRAGNTVIAGVYGRNEIPNVKTGKILDKIRNFAVGAGAIAGVSKIQWKMLVKGLLSDGVGE